MESALPADVRDFIARHIVSLQELEVLLLLHAEMERDWSAAEINVRLRSQEASIAKWLEVLVSLSLVSADGGRYRFSPSSEEVRQRVSAVAAAYQARRIKVIESIFSKPNETLLSFVQAFDLRKKP